MSDQQTYTIAQLADRWQCDRSTVVRMIHADQLHAINLSASPTKANWRITADSVRDFEGKRSNRDPEPKRRARKAATTASGSGTWY